MPVIHFNLVRLTIALVMIGLLVHLQVAGVVCVCSDDDDHGAAHAHDLAADEHDSDAAAESSPSSPDADEPKHDHDGGPERCQCSPTPVFAAPRSATIAASLHDGSWFVAFRISSHSFGIDAPVRRVEGRHARPPPWCCGVNSSSPWSLPVLQV